MVPIEVLIVLQPANDDSWMDFEIAGELEDRRAREIGLRDKGTVLIHWNQPFLGKTVGFCLLAINGGAFEVYEHISTSMQDDVSRFVEEREPQLIFTFGIETKLHKGLSRTQPSSSSEYAYSGELRNEHDGNADGATLRLDFVKRLANRSLRESTDVREPVAKRSFIVGFAP